MANVEKVGTRLVAEGGSNYIRTMTQAGQANNTLKNTIKGLAVAAVTVGLARVFGGMAREAVQAVSAHEQLTMSMTSLVAKELRAADSTLQMTEAMDKAGDRATELLDWIQQLAIVSPFSQQGVAQAFRTALAYGFTSDEAQRLTASTIDFATATGQSVGVMNQVALALGQIKAKGKLAGQEILQLVNAGFSVNPVLEELGYTTADVSAGLVSADEFLKAFVETLEDDFGGAAERSAETIDGLTDSMADLRQIGLRKLFEPAIEATLPALSGLVSKMQEMMPVLESIGQGLGRTVTWLFENKTAVLQTAAAFGVFFAVLNAGTILSTMPVILAKVAAGLTAVVGVIGVMLSPLGILAGALAAITLGLLRLRTSLKKAEDAAIANAQNMGKSGLILREALQEPAENSHSWGYNLIINFANGMAEAMSAVIGVLTKLANQIAYWLSPGSPPRLLPDIDSWGTEAMQEYVDGFGKADFGLFRDIAGNIEQLIRSQGAGDDPAGMIGDILGGRGAVMEALRMFKDTGNVTEEAFQEIFDAADISSGAMQDYVRAAFEAARASEAVKAAQEELNAVSEKYKEILEPLNAELRGIQQRRQNIIDEQRKTELKAILSDENAPALAKELAQMELREIELKKQIRNTEEAQSADEAAAQAKLDAAQAEAEAAQRRLEVQQELIDIQIQNNQLLEEQAEALKEVASAIEGATGGAGGLDKLKSDMGGGGLAKLKSDMEGIGGLPEQVGDDLSELSKKFEQFKEDLKAPFAGIKEEFDEMRLAWARAGLDIIARFQPLRDWLMARMPAAWRFIKMETAHSVLGMIKVMEPLTTWLRTTLTNAWNTAKRETMAAWEAAKIETATVTLNTIAALEPLTTWLRTTLTNAWNTAKRETMAAWEAAKIETATVTLNTIAALEPLTTWLREDLPTTWAETKEKTQEILKEMTEYVTDRWGEGGTWSDKVSNLQTMLNNLVSNALNPLKEGFNRVKGAIEGVVDWIGNLISKIGEVDFGALGPILPFSPPPLAQGLAMVQDQMKRMSTSTLPQFGRAMGRMAMPMTQAMVTNQTISNQTSNQFNFGGNNIYSGMDAAEFDARVMRVVNSRVTG